MKLKLFFINCTLLFLSSYLPLLGFSILNLNRNEKVSNRKYDYKNDSIRIENKVNAVKNGYMPTYHPIRVVVDHKDVPEIFPIGSLPLTKSYYCDEGYGLTTFKTDRFGLRNSENKWDNLIGKPNIFVLGDSFIHCACIDNYQTIPSVIEKETNINTMNLGMGGNGPYNYHATLKSIVKPIIKKSNNENIILINFYADDFYSLNYYQDDFHKRNLSLLNNLKSIIKIERNKSIVPKEAYIEKLTTYIKSHYPISKDEMISQIIKPKQKNKNFKTSYFYQIFTLVPLRYNLKNLITVNKIDGKDIYNPTKNVIEYLSDFCIDKCKAFISLVPNSEYWDPLPNFYQYKKEIKNHAEKNNITFIDGEKIIDKSNKEQYAPYGVHLNIETYKKYGTYLASKIMENLKSGDKFKSIKK